MTALTSSRRPAFRTGTWLALLCLVPAAGADKIFLTDGAPLEDVKIDDETITSVTYEKSGQLESVPSERVLRVEFARLPRELDQAETAVEDGDLVAGLEGYEAYLEEIASGARERRKWAPPFAAKRAVELNMSLGDLGAVVEAADQLLERFPESRYAPDAFLAKATAQSASGDVADANATLKEFATIVAERGLATRWKLECDLALVLTDEGLVGERRRERLSEIVTAAGDAFPVVRNRANLARGESLVTEAASKRASASPLLAEARTIFQTIADDPYATDDVLAGAYTGLGDCLFWGKGDDQERLLEAGMSYMRVPVLYKEQSRYVAKAMFYAGRCFDQLDDVEQQAKARKLYLRVIQEFPASDWAAEAKNFL